MYSLGSAINKYHEYVNLSTSQKIYLFICPEFVI